MTAAVIAAPIGLLMMMGEGRAALWIGGLLLATAVVVGFAQGFWGDESKDS